MTDQYTINEILSAVDDLENSRKKKLKVPMSKHKEIDSVQHDIPSQTLKLIEEAEKTIRSKLQSE